MLWGPGRTFHPTWMSQNILRGTSLSTQGRGWERWVQDRMVQGGIPTSPPLSDFWLRFWIPLPAGAQGLQELKAVDRWGWQQEQSNGFGRRSPQLLQPSLAFYGEDQNCSSPESGQRLNFCQKKNPTKHPKNPKTGSNGDFPC